LSLADLRKWDARYHQGAYSDRHHPTELLERFVPELHGGRALDVACGAGRNSLYLAAAGFDVDAVDISTAGLARLRADAESRQLEIRTHAADLENGIPESLEIDDSYDLIVMVRYVNQPLIESLLDRLRDGGVFISEQHLKTDRDVVGPRSDAYRLEPMALLHAARGLGVHFYREGIVTDPDGRRAALAQLVAAKGKAGLFDA
jgi:tellurite methyltransferase